MLRIKNNLLLFLIYPVFVITCRSTRESTSRPVAIAQEEKDVYVSASDTNENLCIYKVKNSFWKNGFDISVFRRDAISTHVYQVTKDSFIEQYNKIKDDDRFRYRSLSALIKKLREKATISINCSIWEPSANIQISSNDLQAVDVEDGAFSILELFAMDCAIAEKRITSTNGIVENIPSGEAVVEQLADLNQLVEYRSDVGVLSEVAASMVHGEMIRQSKMHEWGPNQTVDFKTIQDPDYLHYKDCSQRVKQGMCPCPDKIEIKDNRLSL